MKLNSERKKAESVRSHVAPPETDARTLPSKPEPQGDTQINGEMSQPEILLSYWSNIIANNMVPVWLFQG